MRVEHWANALNQGPAAARNMLGRDEAYDRIPYFFSDQYDVGMEYSGLARGSDEVVLRGDLQSRELIAFWLADGRVAAGMNINVWDVTEPIQALIRSRAPVDPARLRDPGVPLEELLPTGGARAPLAVRRPAPATPTGVGPDLGAGRAVDPPRLSRRPGRRSVDARRPGGRSRCGARLRRRARAPSRWGA